MASSSRGVQQDAFIDEEEETCPLCVEEFDLSDKSFKPCPCGYQVCQFCFNNIRTNMNGLCPACRRPYSDETIVYNIPSQEQVAQFKANAQKNAKKKAVERQKELQKRELEGLNRKHLAGLRVVQRNLVYVMGLSPSIPESELLKTLRDERYFGQYGEIIKIAVGKPKTGESAANVSALGVYVTFARKEDAAKCIAAVNGSKNGDRVLRAQLGTTKYCSAYLRNEICTNKSCMFLHEPGDNDDSYSRQDLSTINSAGTQRPLPVSTPSNIAVNRQAAQVQAPMQQAQPVAAASPAMARDVSKDGSDNAESSALPTSAAWAKLGLQSTSRRGSVATSGAASSPAVSHALPAPAELPANSTTSSDVPSTAAARSESTLDRLCKSINQLSLLSGLPSSESVVSDFPPLFDDYGGAKRRAAREYDEARLAEEESRRIEQDLQSDVHTIAESQDDDVPGISGSLQLGGEPDDADAGQDGRSQSAYGQRRSSSQMPISRASNESGAVTFGQPYSQGSASRSLTPQQQQQQKMLGLFTQPQSSFNEQYLQGAGPTRQSSRFTFPSDTAAAKSPSSSKVGAQAMTGAPQVGQFYGSVQGPPPGLKSTATPSTANGPMFGQGQSFGGALGGAFGTRPDNEMYRDMLRNRTGQAESGKLSDDHGLALPDEAAAAVDNLVADDAIDIPAVASVVGSNNPSRSGTPSIPPGFEGLSHSHPSPPKMTSRMEPKTAPFTPSRATSYTHTPLVATPLANVSTPGTPIQRVVTPVARAATPTKAPSNTVAKKAVKSLADSTGLAREIAAQREEPVAPVKDDDFPALNQAKKTEGIEPVAALNAKSGITGVHTGASPATPTPPKAIPRRERSVVLTIPASASTSVAEMNKTAPADIVDKKAPTQAATTTSAGSFPALPPSTPAALQTPAVHRSLRIVATPKVETPPVSTETAPAPAVTTAASPAVANLVTASRLERPGTPASEHISDEASVGTTLSRPNSPPPARIGSAPVREKTKNQQKKQRREAQREKEKVELEAMKEVAEPEVHIAPIEGRKKKQKKEKPGRTTTGTSTPAVSRPPSPTPSSGPEIHKAPKVEAVVDQKAQVVKAPAPEPEKPYVVENPRKGKNSKRNISPEVIVPPVPPAPTAEAEKEPERVPLTPMSILEDLSASGAIDKFGMSLLKQLSTTISQRPEITAGPEDFEPRLVITDEDRSNLQAGRPVSKNTNGSHRILLTPNGDCVRNLTPQEEQKYLELQRSIAENLGPTAFVSNRRSQSYGFSLIQGRAVPNGTPSFIPVPQGPDQPPLDAVGKIQRDEALSYINQYVLPSLSTNSQLERALNANALDSGMHPRSNAQTWGSWSASLAPAGAQGNNDTAYGGNGDGGILATGLESMTAHFAVGRDNHGGQPLGNVQLLSLPDSESALQSAKKETEKLEKQFNQLLKKNRKLLLGAGH